MRVKKFLSATSNRQKFTSNRQKQLCNKQIQQATKTSNEHGAQ